MRKKIVSLLLAGVMALSLMACGSSSQGEATSTEDAAASTAKTSATSSKTLRLTQSSGGVVDPAKGTDCASCIASVNVYDSLVTYNMDNEVVPDLAESWTTSEDGLTWTFTLKKGVKFHDGSELQASDVVYSMNRLLTVGQGFAYLFSDYVDSTEATDDTTVVFHLKNAYAPFLSILPRLYIVNEDLVKSNYASSGDYGENADYGTTFLSENDAGSGAYTLESFTANDGYTLKKYNDYFSGWDDKPNAPETVDVIMNTEAATVRTMMNNGEIQMSDQWQSNEAYEALGKIDGVTVGSFPSGQVMYMMLNTKKAPTDDVHVRKALAYMIDYDQVTNTLFPGYTKCTSQVISGILGAGEGDYNYSFDLDKAKEELEQSKYYDDLKSGSKEIEIEWVSDVPDEEKLAMLLQSTGSQIGVSVKVTKVPWATHVNNCGQVDSTPNASVCFMASDYPEAGGQIYNRYDSATAGTWMQTEWLQDEDLDASITDALQTLDDNERASKYEAILKEASDEVWGIAVAEQSEKHAVTKGVTVPAIEKAAAGESVSKVLGYNYVFRDYEMK